MLKYRAMFITIVHNDSFSLAMDEVRHLVRLRRGARRFESTDALQAGFAELFRELERIVPMEKRSQHRLLLDMRAAPLLARSELEAAQEPLSSRLRQGWGRLAVLVQTPIGTLQARRTRSSNSPWNAPAIFNDEIAALQHLTEPNQ